VRITDGVREFRVADPWHPADSAEGMGWFTAEHLRQTHGWCGSYTVQDDRWIQARAMARNDEPGMGTDPDQDGICDFDEEQEDRLHKAGVLPDQVLDPTKADTDNDGENDMRELVKQYGNAN